MGSLSRYRLWILVPLVSASALLTACGGGSGSGSGAESPSPSAPSNPGISGKLVAPDGTTPVANALVYVENGRTPTGVQLAKPMSLSGALPCGAPSNPAWPATCSGSDGSFQLNVAYDVGSKLIARIGAFEAAVVLPAPDASGQTAIASLTISSGQNGQDIKMAVVTGAYDSIENVLSKLGFVERSAGSPAKPGVSFTRYNGYGAFAPPNVANQPVAAELFMDKDNSGRADLFDYAIVFLNCGLDEEFWLQASNLSLLRRYIEEGGRLYVSDLAYDVVEHLYPAKIDFLHSEQTAVQDPEDTDVAEEGAPDITVNATVDPQLREWLRALSCVGGPCVQADGTVTIDGFSDGWAMMNGPHANGNVQVWLSGLVSTMYGATQERPLAVSFDAGLGRVTYTSHHNDEELSEELLPKQRVLQFLVFVL